MTEKLYKWLNGAKSTHADFTWPLPTKNEDGTWTPGEWVGVEGPLEMCKNGLHLCRAKDLLYWCAPDLYEAEADGDRIEDNSPPETKIAVRHARLLRKVEAWNEHTARLFAVWWARQALGLIENPDPRSIAACDVAERYANNQADEEELAAARDAAWDAAGDAAWTAAWTAARDAARAAARDAAWTAARDAAWTAARAAAGAAAWDAAGAAAWDAQVKYLLEMLGEDRHV